jgi:STAS domain-containing protein
MSYVRATRCDRRGIAVAEGDGITRNREDVQMLKITTVEEEGRTVRLKLEGKVTAQWAALLDGECQSFLRRGKTVLLDCAGVDFLDEQGIDVLRRLPLDHVTLISAPGFVTELLQTGGRS